MRDLPQAMAAAGVAVGLVLGWFLLGWASPSSPRATELKVSPGLRAVAFAWDTKVESRATAVVRLLGGEHREVRSEEASRHHELIVPNLPDGVPVRAFLAYSDGAVSPEASVLPLGLHVVAPQVEAAGPLTARVRLGAAGMRGQAVLDGTIHTLEGAELQADLALPSTGEGRVITYSLRLEEDGADQSGVLPLPGLLERVAPLAELSGRELRAAGSGLGDLVRAFLSPTSGADPLARLRLYQLLEPLRDRAWQAKLRHRTPALDVESWLPVELTPGTLSARGESFPLLADSMKLEADAAPIRMARSRIPPQVRRATKAWLVINLEFPAPAGSVLRLELPGAGRLSLPLRPGESPFVHPLDPRWLPTQGELVVSVRLSRLLPGTAPVQVTLRNLSLHLEHH